MDKLCRLSHSTGMCRDTQAYGGLPFSIEPALGEIIFRCSQRRIAVFYLTLLLSHCLLSPAQFLSSSLVCFLWIYQYFYLVYILTTPLLHHHCCPLLNLVDTFQFLSCFIFVTLTLRTFSLKLLPYSWYKETFYWILLWLFHSLWTYFVGTS